MTSETNSTTQNNPDNQADAARCDLSDYRILIMATDGFEQSELLSPRDYLSSAGAQVTIATPGGDSITGWDQNNWGETVKADIAISDVETSDYDALVLPGGQMNPDILRTNQDAICVIQTFDRDDKLIAAICHAPWLLIEAGLVRGLKITSYETIRTDLKNAGAKVVDKAVALDGNIITSRFPDDLPAFTNAIADYLIQNVRQQRQAA